MQPGDTEQQAVPQTRPCDACGAMMERGQDWCLECGTAAPGRLGTRPGMRAAATVVSLTLALVGGAVAASYAALDSDSQQAANQPAPPSGDPVAQAPPGAIQSPAPSDALPPQTTPPGGITTPTVPTPGATTTPTVPTLPNIPQITPPQSSTPSTSKPPTITIPNIPSTPNTGGNDDDDQSGGNTPEDEGDGGTQTTTTPSKQTPQPIDIAADAAAHYDPSNRATAKGDPADAVDDDAKSAWFVTTAGAGKDMATGLVIDLKSARGVRVLELATSTPGFRAEIYASDSAELPPDILDTRWAHITDRSKVDQTDGKDRNKKGDGRERIVLGGGSAKYRHVLIWLTTPPSSGSTVRISDVDLFG